MGTQDEIIYWEDCCVDSSNNSIIIMYSVDCGDLVIDLE